MRFIFIEISIGGKCIQVNRLFVKVRKVSHVLTKRFFKLKEGLNALTRVKPVS